MADSKTVEVVTDEEGYFEVFVEVGGGPGIQSVSVNANAGGGPISSTSASQPDPEVQGCSESDVVGSWSTEVSYDINRNNNLTLNSDGTASDKFGDTGTWLMVDNTVTIIIAFVDDGVLGTDSYRGALGSDCSSMTGTASSELGNDGDHGTFSATKK